MGNQCNKGNLGNMGNKGKEKIVWMQDFMGNELAFECLGCAIARGEILPPGGILIETEDYLVHQDPLVPIEGFLILTVKHHIASITLLTTEQRHRLIDLLNDCICLLKKLHIADEITIIQEERSSHLHFWMFPWKSWMKDMGSYKDICEDAKQHATTEQRQQVVDLILELRKYLEQGREDDCHGNL